MAGESREFGPYRLVRRLGVGGMAETFEATREGAGGFEHRVCLKRVLPAFSQDERFVSRFQREANLAAQLRHTNIVGVVDFGEVDGVHYMALELVDGVDLRSLIKSTPGEKLASETVALVALDLAYALEHAHSTLVHRDVSPSNILLSRSGEAKLADFGIAKSMDDATVTASRSAQGKMPYMSPEHIRGEPVDGRADLFSLGVVLFEALAGARPFDGAHDVETMQRILAGNRKPLAELAQETPKALCEIVERLLEVDRNTRLASAAELIEALAVVAPPFEARRELAAVVEGYRGGPESRLHVRAREEEPDTELSRRAAHGGEKTIGNARESGTRPQRHGDRKRRRVLILAAAALGVLVVAVGGSRWLERSRPTPTVSVPASVSVPAPAPVPASAPADPPSERQEVTQASRGRLRVIVHPWGDVWIDGKYMERAPVTTSLTKGRHVVTAGYDLPTEKRVVWIQPGARKQIEISLDD